MDRKDLIKLWDSWSKKYLSYFKLDHLELNVSFEETEEMEDYSGLSKIHSKYYKADLLFNVENIRDEEYAVDTFIHELLHYVSEPLDEIVCIAHISGSDLKNFNAKVEQQVVLLLIVLKRLRPDMFEIPEEYLKYKEEKEKWLKNRPQ